MKEEKECQICHKKFTKGHGNFCSQSCSNTNANYIRHGTKISEDRTQRICSQEKCELADEYQPASNFYPHNVKRGGWVDSDGIRRYSYCRLCHIRKGKTRNNTLHGYMVNRVTDCRGRTKKKGYPVQVDFDTKYLEELWKKQDGKCTLTGIKMTHNTESETRCNPTNASVDRIDNDKYYTKDNIQLICVWAQNAKNDYSQDQFISWVHQMSEYQKTKIV